MIGIFTSGWSQKVGDSSPIWTIADAVEQVPGVSLVERHDWKADFRNSLLAKRPGNPKVLVGVYSYGAADLFYLLRELEEDGKLDQVSIDFLVIIAGVNRIFPPHSQVWEDCWEVPRRIRRAIAICTVYRFAVPGVLPVYPECCPIRGALSWNEASDDPIPQVDRLNVNVFLSGVTHGSVVELPLTKEIFNRAAIQLIEEERAGDNA